MQKSKLLTRGILIFSSILWATQVAALSSDPELMKCQEPKPINSYVEVQCEVDQEGFVPPDSTVPHPVIFLYQPADTKPVRLKVTLSGYSSKPIHCVTNDSARPGYLVIKPCAGHYPDITLRSKPGQATPAGWWGWFLGNSNSQRLWLSLNKAVTLRSTDLDAGVLIEGQSYGGTGAILQSMLLRYTEPVFHEGDGIDWGSKIAIVHAFIPDTLMVKNTYPRHEGVKVAWAGQNLEQADFRTAAASGLVQQTYYRLSGSPADTSVRFDLEFFDICEEYKISCMGTWHDLGHNTSEPGVNMPFLQLFPDPNQDVRLDQLLPVFTKSTANQLASKRGHYNLGLSWNSAGIVDTETQVVLPIKYQPYTNIGKDVPDQPSNVTFDLTIRRPQAFPLKTGEAIAYTVGDQKGQAVVSTAGEVTITGIHLQSAGTYTKVTLSKGTKPKPKPKHKRKPVAPPSATGDLPLVYTRQPRLDTPITYKRFGTGVIQTLEEGAQWQDWYDAGEPDNFTNADLVYDDRKGNITTLFDCTTGDELCAAHDGRVSPDATKVVFTVARGTSYRGILMEVYGIVWRATSYELWVHDLAAGTNTKIDDNARMGEWCGNDCLVFASDRAGHYPPWANAGPDYAATGFDGKAKGLHIYRADYKDGKLGSPLNISPHAVSCLSPSVNLDGTVQASCWNGFGERGYKRTPLNMYWIEQFNGNGTGHRVTMNAHSSPVWEKKTLLTGVCRPDRCGEGGTMFRVLRSQVPLRGNRFAVANYYRANHQGGLGTIFICNDSATEGFSRASDLPHVEPPRSTAQGSGHFAPNCYVATPYGNDQDMVVLMHKKNGKAMGKAGYPFPVPQAEGVYGFTHCRGNCYSADEEEINAKRSTFGGEPTSKREIRLAYADVITDPFDPAQSKCIAGCEEKWNAFDARVVTTYQNLYGKSEPDRHPAALTGTRSILNIVNSRQGEIHKLNSGRDYDDCSLQGCADEDWQDRIAAIRITEVKPWLTNPLRKGFASTNIVGDFPLAADGSISIDMACGFTYQLGGIDKDGNVVAQDHSLHHAICGETVTCHGCHDAHSEERTAELEPAIDMFMKTDSSPLGSD
jgi:Hydrazine synthase alpha subunit middle domain